MYDAHICLRDVKPINTQGGTFTTGDWRTRDLNDEQADTLDICTLAANQFTLPAASYRCLISCPAFAVNTHQARLYNVTDSTLLLLGPQDFAQLAQNEQERVWVSGRFTLAAEKVLEVQHRGSRTQATYGFGYQCPWGDGIFTVAEFWREREPE